jgi:hypothetical protein
MALNTPHPMAIEHLPIFVAGPGETDVFFNIVIVVLIVVVMLIGVFYFYLHSLPEHMAQKANSRQLQFVALLSMIALFTHNNYYWIAALLLAAVKIPDFVTPLYSIANSLKNRPSSKAAGETLDPIAPPNSFAEAPEPNSDIPTENEGPESVITQETIAKSPQNKSKEEN